MRRESKGKRICRGHHHHQKFNHKLVLSSHNITSCLHVGFYVMNALDYNYKLRNIIGQEDDCTVNTWKWFDTQVRDRFLLSRMISWSLVDYNTMRRVIGYILDNVYAPFMSIKDSIGSITSSFHKSVVVHLRSNDYLRTCNIIHGNMLSLSSKKQRNGKVSLNNGILRVDYKMMIAMLMKNLCIAK